MTPPPPAQEREDGGPTLFRGGWFVDLPGCEASGPWLTREAALLAQAGQFEAAHAEEARARNAARLTGKGE